MIDVDARGKSKTKSVTKDIKDVYVSVILSPSSLIGLNTKQ